MLSYIASNSTASLIKNICQEQNITILNEQVEKMDFFKYIKQTKVNFNLIKHLILDLNQLENTEEDIINSVKYFREIYVNTRIIIIAKGFEEQNNILTSLYENGIYNIINAEEEVKIKEDIKRALSEEGLQQKDAKRFKKIEEVKDDKKRKYKKSIFVLNRKLKREYEIKEQNKKTEMQAISNSVYFFAILLEAVN